MGIQAHEIPSRIETESDDSHSQGVESKRRELRDGFHCWLDATINQASLIERNHQVTHMKDIYSRADHVISWLGEDIEDIAKAAINSISHIFRSVFDDEEPRPDFARRMNAELWDYDENGIHKVRYSNLPYLEAETTDWRTFRSFFSALWFTRRWIVQEFALAKHKILCICVKWYID